VTVHLSNVSTDSGGGGGRWLSVWFFSFELFWSAMEQRLSLFWFEKGYLLFFALCFSAPTLANDM